MTSSDSEDTKGMIMMPITTPGGERAFRGDVQAQALAGAAEIGRHRQGAKKPYTTVGIPAKISSSGLTPRNRALAYSAR